MTLTIPQMCDELRLRWMEERDFLEIIKGKAKRPAEEIHLKEGRLETLQQIGSFIASLQPHEAAIRALVGHNPSVSP